MTTINIGKVILTGAGPGDPDLITYKAIKALRSASVVLTDRLVSPLILKKYVSTSAEIIYVGKQAHKSASASQEYINYLLIKFAREGKTVVRLKGGDVSIFSNVHSELEVLKKHEIPYEIIPGITAASGAAAYSGIPLTARGYSASVRYICFYKSDSFGEHYWSELAETDDTLVFYMSGQNLSELVEKLVGKNIDKRKLMAIIEQATTPLQNVFISSLYDYRKKAKRTPVTPAIVIIGKVVALHKAFAWMQNSNSTAEYFSKIESRLISYNAVADLEQLIA